VGLQLELLLETDSETPRFMNSDYRDSEGSQLVGAVLERGSGTEPGAGLHMSSLVDVLFINDFSSCYVRNNKSKVKKNVRCFPLCHPTGHIESQFCGQSVRIKVASQTLGNQDLRSLLVLGCFCSNKDDPLCDPGKVYPQTNLQTIIHAHNMIQGSPVTVGGIFSDTFSISSRSGWNYLNSVNQTRGQACHDFQVFCFLGSDAGFQCVAACASPSFQVSSTKRNKKSTITAEPDSAPKKKRVRTTRATTTLATDSSSLNAIAILRAMVGTGKGGGKGNDQGKGQGQGEGKGKGTGGRREKGLARSHGFQWAGESSLLAALPKSA
jgi:hypothetical protein